MYLRRNIKQVEKEVEGETGGQTEKEWQYEEQELSVAEYEQMILMQQVVEKKTEEIMESVTQFQKEAVIDEYTMQLIEEGLI